MILTPNGKPQHPWFTRDPHSYTARENAARERYLTDWAARMSLAQHAGETTEPPSFDRAVVENEGQ